VTVGRDRGRVLGRGRERALGRVKEEEEEEELSDRVRARESGRPRERDCGRESEGGLSLRSGLLAGRRLGSDLTYNRQHCVGIYEKKVTCLTQK
jgi:hypothetical protein